MLRQRDIIVFSDDWGRHPSSCQHIVKHFLPENRVFWVNTIGIRRPQLTVYDLKRSFEKIRSWLISGNSNGEHSVKNLIVLNPFIIPYNEFRAIRYINKKLIVKEVTNIIARFNLKEPIVLTTFPNTVDLVHAFGEVAHIYYCVDDFTNWPGVNKDLIKSMEDDLLDKCDIVLASSGELCVKKERNGKKPILLPHGVDFEHFSTVLTKREKPEMLTNISAPIIGFFGAISSWIDFDLITELATSRPTWSFVFIGPIDTDVSKLTTLKNLYFVGKVPYEELPKYAAAFDVSTIPFLVNDLTVSVNPLKLIEYTFGNKRNKRM